MLNELRAEAGETPALHKNVLRDARKAMDKLGNDGRLNFEPATYIDKQGKPREILRFSDEVILPVVGAVGGKVGIGNAPMVASRTAAGGSSRKELTPRAI